MAKIPKPAAPAGELIELQSSFRKVEPTPPFRNGVFTFQGVDYLVHVLAVEAQELTVETLGFYKSPAPIKLPSKKLELLRSGFTATVKASDVKPIVAPFAVLTLQQYAAHNAMLFTKLDELALAAEWTPYMATETPKVFSEISPDSPRTA